VPPPLIFSFCDGRQTVFYTPSTLTVSEKQIITGSLSCAPNARNNRDLDIRISYQIEGEEMTEAIFKM
jgi:type I protein arginine methyltransferase